MKILLLLILLVGCGKKETFISTSDTGQPRNVSQFASCVPPRNPDIIFAGVPCRLQTTNGDAFQYQCANGRLILMNCQGNPL